MSMKQPRYSPARASGTLLFPRQQKFDKRMWELPKRVSPHSHPITLRWEISAILAKWFFSVGRLVDRRRFPALWFLNWGCISHVWDCSPCRHFATSSWMSYQSLRCKRAGKHSLQASSIKAVKGELRQPWVFPAEQGCCHDLFHQK